MEKVQLRNGISIPSIGLGTWKIIDKEQLLKAVSDAYKCGYQLFDTAMAYANEVALGRAFRELRLPREKLFIQDKLWNTCYGYEKAQEACKRSLKKLKTDYLDAYLIHWPVSAKQNDNWRELNAETWRGLEQLYKEGCVRAIGVCNFKKHHLEEVCKTAAVLPFINQVESHPGMWNAELTAYCKEQGIQMEASSPLGNGQILSNDKLCLLAEEKGITVAQLCLKWALQHGYVVIPKTIKEERMKENIQLDHFKLSGKEMQFLDDMPFSGGLGLDSDEVISFEGF